MKRLLWCIVSCLISLVPTYVHAQTTTYHLHKETSDVKGVLQIKLANPDAAAAALQSTELKGQPAGEYLIKAFITPKGVPGVSGVIPKGAAMVFTLWMKKTANYGVVYPLARLRLNSATGTLICTAAGSTPLTTTLSPYALSCNTTADISISAADRYYLWSGVNMATGPGTNRVKAELDTEGTLNGNYDSRFIMDIPTVSVSGVTPATGPVGTSVTIDGMHFGATQGASTITFNGVLAAANSWSDTTIVSTVPSGVSLSTGPMFVTVNGVRSNAMPFSVPLPGGIITTVAGNGNTSYGGSGSAAAGTGIGAPKGVAIDRSGNLYIAQMYNILKVNADGILSALLPFNDPDGVAVDALGNVFIADDANHKIIKVSPDNVASTVAGTGTSGFSGDGGPATSAQLSFPNGVAVDGQGNLFISEGNRIRKVGTDGIISTVAGNGTSGFSGDGGPALGAQISPRGVAVDGSGNIFINDQLNQRVRKVAPDGIITTFAGNGTTGSGGDGGLATSAQLYYPEGVAVDSNGNVYIADHYNNRVRKVNAAGIIATVAGDGAYSFGGDGGPAINAQLRYPFGVAVDGGGNLLIADYFNYRVRKVGAKVPPAISSISPLSGIAGTLVTVSGSGFGTTQGGSTVSFNGITVTPTSWSDTSIIVPVPTGVTTGPVVVTVDGEASNGSVFIVFSQIASITPSVGYIGTAVTISGSNFGGSQGSSIVTFNGIAALPSSWADTQIIVTVPARATTGPVVVTVGGRVSNGINFMIIPKITSLSQASGSVGTVVTITGYSFGATQGSSSVTFNGIAAVPTSWSDTAIVTQIPIGAKTGPLVVTVGGFSSNGTTFTVPPVISNLSPTSGYESTVVTITGSNFGATQGGSAVTFNGTVATPMSWGDTSVTVLVPVGATTGPVEVKVEDISSNGMPFTVAPKIATLSPSSGQAGTTVTINGYNFGAIQGNSAVTFNGITTFPVSWSDTAIVVPLQAGASTGPVVVTVGGLGSNGVTFTVPPLISNLSPASGYESTVVAITGLNFGATQGGSAVTFNGTAATPMSWDDTSVTVLVPAGATTGPVEVKVGGISSNRMPFTVAPKISSLSPTSGPVGTTVVINGYNFGATQGSSSVTFNGITAAPMSWSDTAIVTQVPVGTDTGQVIVIAAGLDSNGVIFTVTPFIVGITPSSGPEQAKVIISGFNFGASQGNSIITFNGTIAHPLNWSDTSIAVPVPTGATTGPVVVTVNNVSSNEVEFTVLTDVLRITYPYNGSTVNRPDTVVMGRLPADIVEVSVKVNDKLAMVNGRDFAINGVALVSGDNVITATMTYANGATTTTSITVYCSAYDDYVKLSPDQETSLAPMTMQLSLATNVPSAVSDMTLSIDGPAVYSGTVAAFPITLSLPNPGIYLVTVTVRTIDGYTYEDKIAVNALDESLTEALLKSKWDAVQAALIAGNIEGGLAYFVSTSQERYRTIFTGLQPSLSQIFGTIEDFHLLSVNDVSAEAEAIRTESGETFSYPIMFDRSETGFWKFRGF